MKIYKSTCIVYHPDYIKEQLAEVDSIQALNDIIDKICSLCSFSKQ